MVDWKTCAEESFRLAVDTITVLGDAATDQMRERQRAINEGWPTPSAIDPPLGEEERSREFDRWFRAMWNETIGGPPTHPDLVRFKNELWLKIKEREDSLLRSHGVSVR